MSGLVTRQRAAFHQLLVDSGTICLSPDQKSPGDYIASISDKSQATSIFIGNYLAKALGAHVRDKQKGQTAGAGLESAVQVFLRATFPHLGSLRPGNWNIENVGGSRNLDHIAQFEPYRHLDDLARAVQNDHTLRAVLGNSYTISPDVIITRTPEPDSVTNRLEALVDAESASRTIIRADNQPAEILHAVVSCKLTLRSDRAQNARSEALNMVRNRKGRAPHIVVVTAEPSPSRLASLALGTGDIDMVYHVALPELDAAVSACSNDQARDMLDSLIDGERLRDIADLPLDLCV